MVSVERIKSYVSMEQEPPHYCDADVDSNSSLGATVLSAASSYSEHGANGAKGGDSAALTSPMFRNPPPYWPSHGAIEMVEVRMKYRPGLPLVLKGLTLSIRSCEKVGIVGRTGAG
jgi:ABC-type multidrug transport system fused ATPase/permease subunit